jgi:uncharacterized membrane protein (DUF2068 family)
MSAQKPSAAVIIAGILAILGSLFAMLCMGLGLMGLYLTPAIKTRPDTPPIPPFAQSAATIMFVVMFFIAVVGIFTGIGLFQLKNWARMAALIWAGITTFFSAIAIVAILLIPFGALPNAQGTNANMAGVKATLVIFYGLPILIGVWWLILFNQKGTKALFTGEYSHSPAATPMEPGCPLPLAILAGFMLFSVVSMFLVPLMHLPVTMILFGERLRGEFGAFLFAAFTMLNLAAAIGLLRLKRWGYWLAFGMYGFTVVSATVTALRSNYAQNMRDIFSEMKMPESSGPFLDMINNRVFALFGVIPILIILGVLVYYRGRFLQAVEAAEAAK